MASNDNAESSATTTNTEKPASEFVRMCTLSELKEIKKFRGPASNRDITLFLVGKDIFAMDSVCYHAGGPLEEGEIEDLGTRKCVICPWHRYKIDLATGEGLYMDMQQKLCTKGKRQRVHQVKVENDEVYVKVDDSQEKMASDHYAFMELYKIKRGPPVAKVHSTRPQ